MDESASSALEVDARGLSCPIPVIRVREAIELYPGRTIHVLIEEQETEENVTRLAESLGMQVAKPAADKHNLMLSPA